MLVGFRLGSHPGKGIFGSHNPNDMKSFLLIILAVTAISCGNSRSSEDKANDVLYNEVMHIHDLVMPKMDDIYKMKRAFLDSMAHTPGMPPALKQQLEGAVANLDSADKAMMNWMHDFDLGDSITTDSARIYLTSELLRIKQVSDQMNESLDKARALLQKDR